MANVYQGSAVLDTSSTDNSDLYRKVTIRLITFFCLCYFAAYLDRINIGLAKLQMLDALKFSDTVYGLGAGLFFAGYILFEVPSNLIL
jgi:sugar phosphate permease